MTPSKRRRGELERIAQQLSDRDWAVLHDLGRVRLLTGRHIQRLHVVEDSPLTQARRTRSLLQRLNDMGLVTRLERRVGGLRAGSAGFTYALSTTGQQLITGKGPAGGHRLRRPWEPSSIFVDHALAVSELYVQLREAARHDPGVEPLDFQAEPGAWRHWYGPSGEPFVLKPDAFVVVATDAEEHFSFLELDRSTESLQVIRRKALTYVSYWQSGQEQVAQGLFPRVVFVVPDERRKAGVVDTLSQLDAESWQLFQVATPATAVAALTGRGPPSAGVEPNKKAM
jgi:hypothetical protein